MQLLTGIFSRKSRRDVSSIMSDTMDKSPYMNEDGDNDMWNVSDESPVIPEPREALHSPYHARTIDQDMENLRLSRQDNPYLQVSLILIITIIISTHVCNAAVIEK